MSRKRGYSKWDSVDGGIQLVFISAGLMAFGLCTSANSLLPAVHVLGLLCVLGFAAIVMVVLYALICKLFGAETQTATKPVENKAQTATKPVENKAQTAELSTESKYKRKPKKENNDSSVRLVLHPNGEVHKIPVSPEDTYRDFHARLVAAGYAHAESAALYDRLFATKEKVWWVTETGIWSV